VKDYLLTLLVAAAVTYVLTPLVRRFAAMIGATGEIRERDVHTAPVPLIGGLAMYAGLAAALLVANQIPQLHAAIANTGMTAGLLAAGGLLVIIGIIDDRWGMNALTKAAGQVAAGGIVVATGTQLSWLPLPGGSGRIFVPTPDQQTLLTILIVVATINAVNFVDGLDGLAAGIVAIAATSFFAYYYSLTKLADISSLAAPALASAVLIGMCLGFLPHNFAPAKIFMGDTGSMLLGLVLAYAPIASINSLDPAQLTSSINRYPVIMPLLLPALLLVIPYGDMLLAVVRRTRAGQSPFAADRKHLHHRLLDIGHSQRASVLIMYLWAAAFSGTVVWLSITQTELPRAQNHRGEPVIVFVLITVAAVAILVLLSMPWRHWGERARAGGPPAVAPGAPAPGVTAGATASQPARLGTSELVASGAPARSAGQNGSLLRPQQKPTAADPAGSTGQLAGQRDEVADDGAGTREEAPQHGGPAGVGGAALSWYAPSLPGDNGARPPGEEAAGSLGDREDWPGSGNGFHAHDEWPAGDTAAGAPPQPADSWVAAGQGPHGPERWQAGGRGEFTGGARWQAGDDGGPERQSRDGSDSSGDARWQAGDDAGSSGGTGRPAGDPADWSWFGPSAMRGPDSQEH
jgi:UDP-GlcNAc:undecaprenyl-phosphate GlcNAc-1-phosphate transferase